MEDKYKYMVGVRCFTFNQSKYILDTLNGFVVQQTNFPYVVMVVDDASTDGEQEVIRKFVDEQFDTNDASVAYEKETDYAIVTCAQHKVNRNCYIAVLYLKENHYSQRKPKIPYLSEWSDWTKYEALCEGDDYWIHPQKLQMQVDFLEENEKYGLVYGKAKTFYQSKNKFGSIIGSKVDSFEDLLVYNHIPTLTVLYRKDARNGYEEFVGEEVKSWMMGDYPLWLYISINNKIHHIDEELCVYRILDSSASHSKDYEKNKKFLHSTYDIKKFFCNQLNRKDLLIDLDCSLNCEMLDLAYNLGAYKEVRKYYRLLGYKQKNCRRICKYVISYIKGCR